MNKEDFVKAEASATRKFMDSFIIEDFLSAPASYTYSREYRCDCGFITSDSSAIFDHCKEVHP